MNLPTHRNASFATVTAFQELLSEGEKVEVRGSQIREIRNHVAVLERPRERCLFLPYRLNNVAASLAETLWVLAGRNDISWLSTYLPKAPNFSDDGKTWRAGYGPRLRDWNGVDQIAQTRRLLLEDSSTRRAATVIFDPDRDFVQSRDIPCTNWLHWLIRDGKLNVTIGMRSNDVMWGFSGVNSFEWSVLQEMMAVWTGTEVGDATYLASSFHLYDRHEKRARKVVDRFRGVTCYDFGIEAPAFTTTFESMDSVLASWFAFEDEFRNDPELTVREGHHLGDPWLDAALRMVRVHHGVASGWSTDRLADELAQLPTCDLTAAAYELYGRQHPRLLSAIPDSRISRFMTYYRGQDSATAPLPDGTRIIHFVKQLHKEKDAAYGIAWKRRGELVSILSNVARKVDRLEQHAKTGSILADESIFDTAIDLFVYLLKYRLFLLDASPGNLQKEVFPCRNPPFSEDLIAFGEAADKYATQSRSARPDGAISSEIVAEFDRFYRSVADGDWTVVERLAAVGAFSVLVFDLVLAIVAENPNLIWSNIQLQSITEVN